MYRHLLVTVDDAPGGIDAIGDALELARAVGARVTFVLPAAAPDSRLSGARLPGHGAKVEAAARAQGLSHGIAGAGQPGAGHPGAGQPGAGHRGAGAASPGVLAGKLGCDLIGVAALPPDADAVARAQRRQLLATSGVPVLVCPSRRADARRALAALAALQNARFGTATEARLFAALRVRAECVAAELDELDRQRQRDTHALGALARLAEDGLPSAAFDAALARYAHGAFEQMGRIEGVIFPAARRYLGDADWTGLDEPPADNAPATPPDTNEPADARRASD
ncbi:universal stress protein [Burkholderia cenocepacia]|uniref:universal stress protein n=1 Tax=Burkholderia cenocepacia TaxID=95486 RepID=UPI001F4A865D|nr:universal stress protein [Burkholderia cenocepacia]